MRLITRNCYALQTWHVSDYIKQAQANIIKQDTHRYITMQNIFRKLYLRHMMDHEKLQTHIAALNDITSMGQSPARAVTEYFNRKAKTYSESFMTATFQYLGKSYQISKSDNSGSLDTLGYKLFHSSEFFNLSEQLKFALRNNKVQYKNLITIVEALLKLQYVDYELINLLFLYTQREIDCTNPEAPLNNWEGDRQFQIQKKNYYNPEDIQMTEGLRSNPELSTAISFVRHIYKEWERDHEQSEDLKKLQISELNHLIEEISETNKNFRKIVEGIIKVRRQYMKMVEYSQNHSVMRNPNLNLDLLNIEEKLLNLKLISMEDIKNINRIKDSKLEIKRIEQILTMYLDITEVTPIFAYIDDSGVNVEEYKERTVPDPSVVSKLLHYLSQLTSVDRFVYHTQDGKSLVNLKWEKTLLQPTTGPYLSNQFEEELNVSRIFRRVYSDTLSFFQRNEEKITSIFSQASPEDKILFLDAYCRMGLQEKAIVEANAFEKDGLGVPINQLSQSSFYTLIHLLNDIGIFIDNHQMKSQVFEQLNKNLRKEGDNKLALGLRQSIDVVNYLIQNHNKNNTHMFRVVYQKYLNILESKTIYYAPQESQGEDLVQAFKILALEKPDKYGSHPTYLNFIYSFVNDKYKKNPYLSILRETCYKWYRKDNLLKKMQTHLNLGITNGLKNGLVFSNSEETSLDGQIRSGNLNSYILRLSAKNKMLVHDLSINAFLNIDYSQEKQPFKLKQVALLEQRLSQIYEYKEKSYYRDFKTMEALIREFLNVYPEDLIATKIRFKLAVIQNLQNNSINLDTKEQEYSNNALFMLQILELSKLIRLLDEKNILAKIDNKNEPDAVLNKPLDTRIKEEEFKSIIKVDIQANQNNLKTIKQEFKNLIDKIGKEIKKELTIPQLSKQTILKGERQTLEEIGSQIEVKNIEKEFFNYRYYEDKTFCEYGDWKQKIENLYNLVELPTDKVSNLTKILTNKFCPHITNKIHLLPICKHSERIKKIDLQFVLLRDAKEKEIKKPPMTILDESEQNELQYIINLQNFKHELKTTFTPQKLIDYILGFKFVLNSNKVRQNNEQKILLKRNPEEYFNYLEELQERTYLESPYAKYIIEKISKTDNIRHLLQKRKDMRISQRRQYQKGAISPETYFARINALEDELIEAVKQLKTKMLDDMENNILSGELKMMEIKKDELDDFETILEKNFSYNRQFDQDFIVANGDYQKAMEYKRGRVESNFRKMYLLKKLTEKTVLTKKEKELLNRWHKDIIRGTKEFVTYNQYSTMTIAQLDWQDLKALKLKTTGLNRNKNMMIIDLIMELNLFLNDSLIQAYQRRFKADVLSQQFDIPVFMFSQSSSQGFKYFENKTEEALIKKHSQLQKGDINTIQELFKILKTEGFKQRNLYASLCKEFRDNISIMNSQSIGSEMIQEYIRVLQDEFMNEYDPILVRKIKKRETDKLWRQIFNDSYESCTAKTLTEKTSKLILRLELLEGKCPPFFGNLIFNLLMHPEMNQLTKQSLITAIQINGINLNIDSSIILELSKMQGSLDPSYQEVKNEMKALSSSKVTELLYKKTKDLI